MDTISADLAGKVLTANQRNIIAKVQGGKTLSGPEMKLFEEVLAQQRELQERRQAALLRRYCNVGRLTADEREEIADLVPTTADIDQPEAAPTKFQHNRTHYADLFDQTPRTINRWISHGKKKGEPPPLDEPAAMSGWWTKHMKHRVPVSLLRFKPEPPAVDPAPPAIALPPSDSVTGDTPPGEPERGSVGMVGMLKRMREAEREASEKYQIAQNADPPDPSLIEMRRRAWDRMAETLRKLEKDSPGILEASGDVLPRDETISDLTQMLGVLALTWRGFARRMLPAMRGMSIEQSDKHWNTESDRVFTAFQENRFSAVVEPSAP